MISTPHSILSDENRRMKWAGHIARMGESRGACRALVGKHDGKRPLGRPRHRWEYNTKMDIPAVGFEDTDWIDLAQDSYRWQTFVNANESSVSIKCSEFLD